jgi:hypothetical protein
MSGMRGSVSEWVAAGYRVESTPVPGTVVLVKGKDPNHILHLLLSVITAGLWLPVWFVMAVTTKPNRVVIHVDAGGKLLGDTTGPVLPPVRALAWPE